MENQEIHRQWRQEFRFQNLKITVYQNKVVEFADRKWKTQYSIVDERGENISPDTNVGKVIINSFLSSDLAKYLVKID